MSELLGKLTNLSYEFFGVILPGVVASLFLVVAWIAMGPMAPAVTQNVLAELRLADLVAAVDALTRERGIGVIVLLVIVWYFLGQLILWLSRSREKALEQEPNWNLRIGLALGFQLDRPTRSYNENLEPLFQQLKRRFARDSAEMQWRQFYPVAKFFLSQNVTYSLITTYQHKYTLHRSISCAAALFFWTVLLVALVGEISVGLGLPDPRWSLIGFCLVMSLVLIWGFSESYMYHWEMFGNTIITESYSALYAPKIPRAANEPQRSRSN